MKSGLAFSLVVAGIVLAAVGLVDSVYLTVTQLGDKSVVCTANTGCSAVLESSWSTMLGLPTSLFGAAYYVVIFFLIASSGLLGVIRWLWPALVSGVGLFVSGWLVYVQIFKSSLFAAFV
jgi:uncharacterized membrane protein